MELSFLSIFLAFLAFGFLIIKWEGSNRLNLSHVPAIGPRGYLTSYLGALRFLKAGNTMIQEGYTRYRNGFCRIPDLNKWFILCCGSDVFEELRRSSEEELSSAEANSDLLQLKYTMGEELFLDQYHSRVVRHSLTRNIADRFSDVLDEIKHSFDDEIPLVADEWRSVPALKAVTNVVCRASNRLFVGLPLCRDPEYLSFLLRHAVDVAIAFSTINLFPRFLCPIVGPWFSRLSKHLQEGARHLGPIIEERLRMEERYGRDWPDKPNDLITWLLEEAKDEGRTVHGLVMRILLLNFASVHTTSPTFTHALYHLAANPEYSHILRAEVEPIIAEEGWTKEALDRMHKVDSFLRESSRLDAISAIGLPRNVKRNYTFSDGTVIPAGAVVAAPSYAIHHDSSKYSDPDSFVPFRFSNMRDQDGKDPKFQMVTPDPNFLIWGHGKHMCPGRFFAVTEMKTMLAYLVVTYDIKFENEGVRPSNQWVAATCLPNREAEVMFRRRVA